MTDIAGRLTSIQHRGCDIMSIDYSQLTDPADSIALIDQAIASIQGRQANSVRLLTNCEGATFTKDTMAAMGRFSDAAKGIAERTAVIGLEGMLEFVAKSAIRSAERNIEVFDSREQALAWLTEA